jgi:hypothetical protein
VRRLGILLLLLGGLAFSYASSRLSELEAPPATTAMGDYLRTESGRWELTRYGGAAAAFIGALLALFPKGR